MRLHYMRFLHPYHLFQEKLQEKSNKRRVDYIGRDAIKKVKIEVDEIKKENPIVNDTR